jgi:hypothetical protein
MSALCFSYRVVLQQPLFLYCFSYHEPASEDPDTPVMCLSEKYYADPLRHRHAGVYYYINAASSKYGVHYHSPRLGQVRACVL